MELAHEVETGCGRRAGCRAAELKLVPYIPASRTRLSWGWNNKFRAPPSLGLRSGARECSRVGAPVVASDHFGAGEPTIGPCGGVGAAVFCSGPIGAELIVSTRSVNRLGFISAEAQQ